MCTSISFPGLNESSTSSFTSRLVKVFVYIANVPNYNTNALCFWPLKTQRKMQCITDSNDCARGSKVVVMWILLWMLLCCRAGFLAVGIVFYCIAYKCKNWILYAWIQKIGIKSYWYLSCRKFRNIN